VCDGYDHPIPSILLLLLLLVVQVVLQHLAC
jgi:hypothetical protein